MPEHDDPPKEKTCRKGDILVVDDEELNRNILKGLLELDGHTVKMADDGGSALRAAHRRPDIILLDIMLPDMKGFDCCRMLKREKKTKDIPVMFISSLDDIESKVRAFEEGGVDYITKPFQREEVLARVKTQLSLRRMRKSLEDRNKQLRREISDRKRMEAEIVGMNRELENRVAERTAQLEAANLELDQIFHTAGDGMYLVDLDCTVIRANKTVCAMFGFGEDDIRGKTCREHLSADQCLTTICPLPAILSGESRVEFDATMSLPDGRELIVVKTAVPFLDASGKLTGMLVNIKDITQRVRAEEQKKIHEKQLIQADKLAAIGTLVSGVAHEVNNPNGIITLNVPMLANFWKDAEKILDRYYETHGEFKLGGVAFSKLKTRVPYLFEQTVESAKRIKRIVSELKDFARQDVSDMTDTIDINEVVKTSVSLVRNKIRKSTGVFSVDYHSDPLLVTGNFQRLEQVVINVLINACQALTDHRQGISVMASEDRKNRLAKIEIHDQGTGMAETDLRHVFEPFFTTKRNSGGTGLGLSVSHGIIAEHNGKIVFVSEPGKGTVCTISLPLKDNGEEHDG